MLGHEIRKIHAKNLLTSNKVQCMWEDEKLFILKKDKKKVKKE